VHEKIIRIRSGEVGIIHSFEKDELYIKLLEMGCVPGEPVKVVQVAPLGDPISIEVSGYHLSLRLSEADNIIVAPAN
jgi:ferrous iron transport protein A